jgi:pimeloyl-ACP methyl ester carboxylesterase
MSQGIAEVNDINIWWEDFGDSSNPTVLLIMGANANAMQWPLEFVNPLVEAGFHVIRFDNRDVGKSTWVTTEPTMIVSDEGIANAEVSYNLEDMATDAVALLDHLGIDKAHIVGASMGGMITQVIGLDHPHKALSLTPIMSTPGAGLEDEHLSPPTESLMQGMMKSMEHNMKGEYLEGLVCVYRELIGSRYPFDEEKFREGAKVIMDHGHNPFPGHGAAVSSSPHRKDRLKEISLPTLVIHGTEDAILPLDHGQALADGIPNAKLMVLEGAGHEIPEQMTEEITSRMIEHFNSI